MINVENVFSMHIVGSYLIFGLVSYSTFAYKGKRLHEIQGKNRQILIFSGYCHVTNWNNVSINI